MIPQKYKRIQELLDERLELKPIVRESNSEVVWRMWDEAVQSFDKPVSNGNPGPRNLGTLGYPLSSFVDGTELT